MGVVLLLALIWAMVLVPPALVSHAARKEAFAVSFGHPPPAVKGRVGDARSSRVRSRRRIAGGLLLASIATLLIGLLPTFRVLLVVHLFLVDSFLAYIALLAHLAQRAARARTPVVDVALLEDPARTPAGRPRRRLRPAVVRSRAVLPEFGPAQLA